MTWKMVVFLSTWFGLALGGVILARQMFLQAQPCLPRVPWKGGMALGIVLIHLVSMSIIPGIFMALIGQGPERPDPEDNGQALVTVENRGSELQEPEEAEANPLEETDKEAEQAETRSFDPRWVLITTILASGVTVALTYPSLVQLAPLKPSWLGLNSSTWLQGLTQAGRGVLALILVYPAIMLIFAIAQQIEPPSEHPMEEVIREAAGQPSVLILSFLTAVVVAPGTEELVYRVVLLVGLFQFLDRSCRSKHGAVRTEESFREEPEDRSTRLHAFDSAKQVRLFWIANGLASLIFAAIHLAQWPAPVPLFFFSLYLGELYRRTGSWITLAASHATLNLMSWLIALGFGSILVD